MKLYVIKIQVPKVQSIRFFFIQLYLLMPVAAKLRNKIENKLIYFNIPNVFFLFSTFFYK